ncbi:hypothetical protein [Cerasicoccus arenae]|uniref:Oligogalacturonide lyase n=1 Tax=Cerasicoccus arenae TaxID=424488 RepID=A0A8J3DC36_9BACT|nr:hypothetical protein [Cerasicoccus arenae]MBK1859819.1 hypothetical protein [Cerasicoccus arenae]GHC01540.1 hypothetical protein GCM10007047_17570 [Cerasicoccus arenae]
MTTPETSKLFTSWENPANGVESFILTERPAPVQQSFYYTHPSFSSDGRFLWLRCGFPPPGGRHSQQVLGVVDFHEEQVRVFPETQFPAESAMVDQTTGEAYWSNHLDIWKRGTGANDCAELVNSFPSELATGRLALLATHPTFSADRRNLNVDARFIQRDGTPICYIGALPLDGSPFELWNKYEGEYYDHGCFSPHDSDLQLFAHEYWQDHEPFDHELPYHRIWLIRRGEQAEPLLRTPVSHSGHEWWSADGRHIWYLHYGVGVKKVDVVSREETLIWPGALSHAHSDRTNRYLVADRMDHPGTPDCHVIFQNTVTGKEIEIVNRGPLRGDLTQCGHLHPHPQFCFDDRYICYTTTVHDRVDIALTLVDGLIARTS